METFVANATSHFGGSDSNKPKKSFGVKTEGVWIGCRAEPAIKEGTLEQTQEEDEMIWWQWDGKIVGFSDW